MFGNKTLLNWQEPRFARKLIEKRLRLKDYLRAWSGIAWKLFVGSYVVFWVIGWLSPARVSNPVLSVDLVIISMFIVGGYSLIWLLMIGGSKISAPQIYLRNKDFLHIDVENNFSIPYKKMESFSLRKVTVEENEFFLLSIKDWDGNECFVEIDPKIDTESIIEIFRSKNVQQKTPLLNPQISLQ